MIFQLIYYVENGIVRRICLGTLHLTLKLSRFRYSGVSEYLCADLGQFKYLHFDLPTEFDMIRLKSDVNVPILLGIGLDTHILFLINRLMKTTVLTASVKTTLPVLMKLQATTADVI